MMRRRATSSHASRGWSLLEVRMLLMRGCFEAEEEVMKEDSGTVRTCSPAAMSLEAMSWACMVLLSST